MALFSAEHYDLMRMFEADKTFTESRCFDKEDKVLWAKGAIYQHGLTNQLFKAYRKGYAYGKAITQNAHA